MKVAENSIVLVPRWSSERLPEFLRDLLKLINYKVQHMYFVLKPSVVSVNLRGVRRLVTIPPSAIIIDESILTSTDDNEITDLALKYGIKIFKLSEDSWVEVKNSLTTNEICIMGHGKISELVQELDLKSSHDTCINEASTCLVIDEGANIHLEEYKRLLNYKHVAILTGLRNIGLRDVEGIISSLWRHHPLLYDLNIWNVKVHIKVADVSNIKEIKLLSKPLVFLDNNVLVMEVSYNNSVLFTSSLPFKTLLIKALFYVC